MPAALYVVFFAGAPGRGCRAAEILPNGSAVSCRRPEYASAPAGASIDARRSPEVLSTVKLRQPREHLRNAGLIDIGKGNAELAVAFGGACRCEHRARQKQHASRVEQALCNLVRACLERMRHIREIGPQSQKPPAFCRQRSKSGGNGVAPREDLAALASEPVIEILDPPFGADLADLRGTDGDGIEEFLHLEQALGRSHDRAHAMAGQPIGFGEGIEMYQGFMPVLARKQPVGRAIAAVEIAIGLVHNQREPMALCQLKERVHQGRGIFNAAGVVGCDQDDCAGARRDQRFGLGDFWQHSVAHRQGQGGDPLHVEPHLVVKVPWRRQDDLVTFGAEALDGGGKGLIAARGDRDLGRCDVRLVVARDLGGESFAQIRIAKHRSVEMGAGL